MFVNKIINVVTKSQTIQEKVTQEKKLNHLKSSRNKMNWEITQITKVEYPELWEIYGMNHCVMVSITN